MASTAPLFVEEGEGGNEGVGRYKDELKWMREGRDQRELK